MATRVLIPQPILPAGYEYLRKHGYEAVDGRGFTEDILPSNASSLIIIFLVCL